MYDEIWQKLIEPEKDRDPDKKGYAVVIKRRSRRRSRREAAQSDIESVRAYLSVGEVMRKIPVLIVGGGPVGLALALDLGWRGVPCLLVEQGDGEIIDAKMFATGIRTVEFCRRWGIADKVKHWGFPHDFPFDNVFVTSLNGHEIGRIADAVERDAARISNESRTLRTLSAIRV